MAPAFIGRSRELKALDTALAQAAAGVSGCLLIGGEAGVGKSRLMREAQRKARTSGFYVIDAACEEPDAARALAGIAALLRKQMQEPLAKDARALLPENRPALAAGGADEASPGEPRQQLEANFRDWLGALAQQQPLLVALEDIHWCDDASLSCLASALKALAGRPILMLFSLRTPHLAPATEGLITGLFVEAGAQQMQLQPLGLPEVGMVMRSLSKTGHTPPFYYLKHVFDVTGGNPLFVEELSLSSTATDSVSLATDLQSLQPRPQSTIPRSIRRIIRQRLQRVSPGAQRVADLCAVHGQLFDLKLVGELTGLSDVGVRQRCLELAGAYVAQQQAGERFAFRHALVREALYDRLLVRERRAWHERLALAIERVYGAENGAQLAALSYHSYKAGHWRKALLYCRRAAEEALRFDAPRVAVTQLTWAIEAASWLTDAQSWELHCLRARALEQLNRCDQALTDYATALDSARMLGDRQAEAQVLYDLAALAPALRATPAERYFGQIVAQATEESAPPAVG